MGRFILVAALCASTGCIITEDTQAGGVTLELEWVCPSEAESIDLWFYLLDEDGLIGDDVIMDEAECGQTQPKRFLLDAGDWYVEAQPIGSGTYYFLWDRFEGEEMEIASLELAWDDNFGAFIYRWEIGGANPATGCNSRDVEEVTLTATNVALPDENFPETFPCNIATAQSKPLPLDEYNISGSPDGGAETVLSTDDIPDKFELVDPAGLLELPTLNILTEPPA